MRLSVDEEVQGFNRDIESVTDMKAAVVSLIDENVIEVSIKKKRAVKDNSQREFIHKTENTEITHTEEAISVNAPEIILESDK